MRGRKPNLANIFLAAIAFFLVVFLVVIVIKPSISGMAVHEDQENKQEELVVTAETVYIPDTTNIDQLREQLIITATNLSSCMAFNEKLLGQLASMNSQTGDCQGDLSAAKAEYTAERRTLDAKLVELESETIRQKKKIKGLEEELFEANDALNDEHNAEQELGYIKEDLKKAADNYNLLAQNTADNICCKMRVDNPNIGFYTVQAHKIICLESGTSAISCIS